MSALSVVDSRIEKTLSYVLSPDSWPVERFSAFSKSCPFLPIHPQIQLMRGVFNKCKVSQMDLDQMSHFVFGVLEGFAWCAIHKEIPKDLFASMDAASPSLDKYSFSGIISPEFLKRVWESLASCYIRDNRSDLSSPEGKRQYINTLRVQSSVAAWMCQNMWSIFCFPARQVLFESRNAYFSPTNIEMKGVLPAVLREHHDVQIHILKMCFDKIFEALERTINHEEGTEFEGSFYDLLFYAQECLKEEVEDKAKYSRHVQLDAEAVGYIDRLVETCDFITSSVASLEQVVQAMLCSLVFVKTMDLRQRDDFEATQNMNAPSSLSQRASKQSMLSKMGSVGYSSDEVSSAMDLWDRESGAAFTYAKNIGTLKECLVLFQKACDIFLDPIKSLCETYKSKMSPAKMESSGLVLPPHLFVAEGDAMDAGSLSSGVDSPLSPENVISAAGLWDCIKRSPRMKEEARSAYENADRVMEDLLYQLSLARQDKCALELFNAVVGISQVLEQRLTAIARHKTGDATIKSHNLLTLLEKGKIEGLSKEESDFIFNANHAEIYSRDINLLELNKTEASSLLRRAYAWHNDLHKEDVVSLRNDVLAYVAKGIIVCNSLQRHFGVDRAIDAAALDAFLSRVMPPSSIAATHLAIRKGSKESPLLRKGPIFVTLRLWLEGEMHMTSSFEDGEEDVGFASNRSSLMQLRTYLDHIENELGRSSLPLQHFRVSSGEQHCYNFLKYLVHCFCPEINPAAYRDDYEAMFPQELWLSLSGEEKQFLKSGGVIRYRARYERVSGDHFDSAVAASSHARKGFACSRKIKSSEDVGTVLCKDGMKAYDHLEMSCLYTLQIAEKLISYYRKI